MPGRPVWQKNFFTGVPAPAGALAGLAPVYALLLGFEETHAFAVVSAIYTLAIGLLMVSSLPTFSGKEMSKQVPRAWVLPLLIMIVAIIALLLSYPWEMLLAFTAIYLGSLPFGYRAWQAHKARDAQAAADNLPQQGEEA